MLKELTSKYIQKTERVFEEIKINRDLISINEKEILDVVETAKRYLEDAKYYQGMEKLETSIVSVAYCEGLLDALRFLGIVEFTW